ncbi:hypothetical protein HK405_006807, partial [Cladochytrium tenue]
MTFSSGAYLRVIVDSQTASSPPIAPSLRSPASSISAATAASPFAPRSVSGTTPPPPIVSSHHARPVVAASSPNTPPALSTRGSGGGSGGRETATPPSPSIVFSTLSVRSLPNGSSSSLASPNGLFSPSSWANKDPDQMQRIEIPDVDPPTVADALSSARPNQPLPNPPALHTSAAQAGVVILTGRVILSLQKPLPLAAELSLHFLGRLHVDVTHLVQTDVTAGKARPVHSVVLQNDAVLWRRSDVDPSDLPAGEHEWAFVLPVRGNLPPTVDLPAGRIEYSIRARLSRVGFGADVNSPIIPLGVVRSRPRDLPAREVVDRDGDGLFRLRARLPSEVFTNDTSIAMSLELTPLQHDSVGVLQSVKVMVKEKRGFSCGIEGSPLMYKDEMYVSKGSRYAVGSANENSGELVSLHGRHAEVNFPLASPQALRVTPCRFSAIVHISQKPNPTIRTSELRVAHFIVIRLDMDKTLYGGPSIQFEIPFTVVAASSRRKSSWMLGLPLKAPNITEEQVLAIMASVTSPQPETPGHAGSTTPRSLDPRRRTQPPLSIFEEEDTQVEGSPEVLQQLSPVTFGSGPGGESVLSLAGRRQKSAPSADRWEVPAAVPEPHRALLHSSMVFPWVATQSSTPGSTTAEVVESTSGSNSDSQSQSEGQSGTAAIAIPHRAPSPKSVVSISLSSSSLKPLPILEPPPRMPDQFLPGSLASYSSSRFSSGFSSSPSRMTGTPLDFYAPGGLPLPHSSSSSSLSDYSPPAGFPGSRQDSFSAGPSYQDARAAHSSRFGRGTGQISTAIPGSYYGSVGPNSPLLPPPDLRMSPAAAAASPVAAAAAAFSSSSFPIPSTHSRTNHRRSPSPAPPSGSDAGGSLPRGADTAPFLGGSYKAAAYSSSSGHFSTALHQPAWAKAAAASPSHPTTIGAITTAASGAGGATSTSIFSRILHLSRPARGGAGGPPALSVSNSPTTHLGSTSSGVPLSASRSSPALYPFQQLGGSAADMPLPPLLPPIAAADDLTVLLPPTGSSLGYTARTSPSPHLRKSFDEILTRQPLPLPSPPSGAATSAQSPLPPQPSASSSSAFFSLLRASSTSSGSL